MSQHTNYEENLIKKYGHIEGTLTTLGDGTILCNVKTLPDGSIVHLTYQRICDKPAEKRYSLYRKFRPVVEKFGRHSRRARDQAKLMDDFDRKYGKFFDFETYDRGMELMKERKDMLKKFYQIALEEGMNFDL